MLIETNTTIGEFIEFVRDVYACNTFIALHEPLFIGNEKKYVNEAIDSTFVSSVGKFVDRFEIEFAHSVGSCYAIAASNGTSALHIALLLSGVRPGEEVITQPLTFVATCNAISHAFATPVFVDVDRSTLGLCPKSLELFLDQYATVEQGVCINKITGKIIRACIPMHTFGFPAKIDKIIEICKRYSIKVVEDAAEALGSLYQNKHVGTFSECGVFSFNGNKIMTTGGGGMIVTDDVELAKKAKHLTTTAKVPHAWQYYHDEVGYNYRMPNLNAALGCAQLENLPRFLAAKRALSEQYRAYFSRTNIKYLTGGSESNPNYWLNAILLESKEYRDAFLMITNRHNVMTRPAWELMTNLPMYRDCFKMDISNAQHIADRLVNIPSTPVMRACI